MLNLSGSTLPILLWAGGGFRRTLSFHRHVPTAAAAAIIGSTVRSSLPPTGTRGGGPWTRQQRTRGASSSSYWKERQERDQYVREAKVNQLKSRAAFKLLEMDTKYRLFKKGALVIDLGYAPGSWSQVAMERTKPTGRVLGIDLIPAQPPRGVGAIQGNFLSPTVRKMAKQLIVELHRRQLEDEAALPAEEGGDVVTDRPSYIDMEHRASRLGEEDEAAEAVVVVADDPEPPSSPPPSASSEGSPEGAEASATAIKPEDKKYVDIVLSDMSEPWPQTSGFGVNALSNPYHRLMNTSGISFRDHAGSMDLCTAALEFANETLKPGGHFVCKFYQGAEDKFLEKRLKSLFKKVYREKPEASRSESKEAYFVAMQRKRGVDLRETEDA